MKRPGTALGVGAWGTSMQSVFRKSRVLGRDSQATHVRPCVLGLEQITGCALTMGRWVLSVIRPHSAAGSERLKPLADAGAGKGSTFGWCELLTTCAVGPPKGAVMFLKSED